MASRIYDLFNKIITVFTEYNNLIDELCSRFYSTTNVTSQVTQSRPSGFTLNGTDTVAIIGHLSYIAVRSDKSSNWGTGNIDNTTFATISFPMVSTNSNGFTCRLRSADIIKTINGGSGGLKSISSTVTYPNDTRIQHAIHVNAVVTADKYSNVINCSRVLYEDILTGVLI